MSDRAVSPLDRLPLRSKPWVPALSGRERQEAALNWPISFASMASPIAAIIRCRSPISRSCRPWSAAAQRLSVATSNSVTPVTLSGPLITPAAIGTAPNANLWPRSNGSINKNPNCCQPDIFILVFTLPHQLNALILVNKKPLINIFFQSVSQTLARFSPNRLGGTFGDHCGSPYLESNPVGSFSSALSGPRRRSVF